MLKGKMSISVVITSFVGFPCPCSLGVRSLSQWTKQLEFKADHFHIVFILRINGTFLSLPLYSFMALCFVTQVQITYFISSNHHHCDLVGWFLFLSKANCGEKVMRWVFLLIIVCWRNLSTKLHDITCYNSLADFMVTTVRS